MLNEVVNAISSNPTALRECGNEERDGFGRRDRVNLGKDVPSQRGIAAQDNRDTATESGGLALDDSMEGTDERDGFGSRQ